MHVDVPKRFVDDWWVMKAILMFDDMTLTNGPTRIVPGSHLWAPINVPYVNIGDREPEPLSAEDQKRIPKDLGAPYPGKIMVTAPARAATICNSSMWHSGPLKHDDTHRRMLRTSPTPEETFPQQLTQIDHLTK